MIGVLQPVIRRGQSADLAAVAALRVERDARADGIEQLALLTGKRLILIP